MANVVGVKFKDAGKMYYFNPGNIKVKMGDHVIVETARGIEFGTVTLEETTISDSTLVALCLVESSARTPTSRRGSWA